MIDNLQLTVSEWLSARAGLPNPNGPNQSVTFVKRVKVPLLTDNNASPPGETVPLYRVRSKLFTLKDGSTMWIWEPANYQLINDEYNCEW